MKHRRTGTVGILLLIGALVVWLLMHGRRAASPVAEPVAVEPGVYAISDAPEDWRALVRAIGTSRVVGLGESIHTSGGFSAVRARIVRHLVREQGFRVLAFETPRTRAEKLDHYVQSCDGDAREAMRGIFPVFANTETLALSEWLCAYNREHAGDRVRVIGFDEQQPWDDRQILAVAFPDAASDLRACDGAAVADSAAYYKRSPSEREAYAGDYDVCKSALGALQATLDSAPPSRATEIARIALVSMGAWQDAKHARDDTLGNEFRDRAMAELFLRMRALDFAGAKVIVWAHNNHLAMAHQAMRSSHWRSMGADLAAKLGSDYFPIGLIAGHVEINWPALPGKPGPLPVDSLEAALGRERLPILFVDVERARGSSLPLWRDVTFGHPENDSGVPSEQFRGFVFLQDSPAMDALFWKK